MTKPVNLYMLSRITGEESFNSVYHHAAEKVSHVRTPSHEIGSVRRFTDLMVSEGVPVASFDGFFLGYSIPQIGKEFDLLKFNDRTLSIELKSQPVPLQQIRTQLVKNRHYLSHLGRPMQLFTFVSDTRECFRLTEEGTLAPADPAELAKAVLSFTDDYLTEIDGLFRPSEYIVSPVSTPEKFLAREYFLTQAQEQVRNHLLSALNETTDQAFFSLTGKPGTGKTLLLYDVGRSLASQAQTAILHWGDLADGHEMINRARIGLTILPWRALDEEAPSGDADRESVLPLLAGFSYLLVDEAHRLSGRQFTAICRTAKKFRQRVVFCLDPEQILTTAQRETDIAGKVASLPPLDSFTLSERLRGNRELHAFIQAVRDLNSLPKTHMDFRDVELGFAGNVTEARRLLAYYRDRGYIFINYMKSARDALSAGLREDTDSEVAFPENPFADFEGGYDINHIIGQEFDQVVMLLDRSFCYTEDGKLEGVPRPDPDILYPNLFYQGITRVREKLALIVLENEPVFDRIAAIL